MEQLAEDTFFDLTTLGQAGLVIVAATLAFMAIIGARLVHRALGFERQILNWPLHIVIAILFLWLFEWLAPQGFYFYFMQLFSYLPLQSVIQEPPTPLQIFRLLTFTAATESNGLSRYSAGALGWILLLQAAWYVIRKKEAG